MPSVSDFSPDDSPHADGNMAMEEQEERQQQQRYRHHRQLGDGEMHTASDKGGGRSDANAISLLHDRVVEKLNATRRDCRAERQELIESVESQLRDMRTELMSARSEEQQLQREMRALQEKLQNAVILRTSLMHDSDNHFGMSALAKTSQRLHRDTQQALSEVELLKAAVFHDRLSREERQKAEDAEDEELEVRLQQTEDAYAELQRTVVQIMAQNKQIVKSLHSIVNTMQHHQPRVVQQQEQLKQALEAFARLQAEHVRVAGTVESLLHSTEQYKATHDQTLRKLEKTVTELERQQNAKRSATWVVETRSKINGDSIWNHDAVASVDTETCSSLRRRLEKFYSLYNPERLSSVDVIIDEYVGAEEELMAALEIHYGAFGFFSHH